MINDDYEALKFALPPLPNAATLEGSVEVWEESVIIPTYEPGEADRYPQYLDQRVYQGSSGRVYPMPFIESIATEPVEREWHAVHMATKYIRLMILPELGGRIYYAEDLTRGYDFFYRNNVIKPALVGVLGPWISGGVEFNWPQHHRPATFLPTEYAIEREDDGAVTVWCSDLSPFERMKGMHGVRLRPDSSLIELRVRLHNRTPDTQTFLWWANVAAPVGDHYQAFFPTDVHFVADHAKRAVTGFPRATVPYYGVDYATRVTPAEPDADRIDWYKNIPVPTSYMCLGSEDDFFGGYDHQRKAGFVHVADHHVAPGKKLWTWGNSRFGWAWDRNLTDHDGPYVELMAGVFTDNQPDFTYLAPGETKAFSQFWYPIQDIGCATQANCDVAVRFLVEGENLQLGIAASKEFSNAHILVTRVATGETVFERRESILPGVPLTVEVPVNSGELEQDFLVEVYERDSRVIAWRPRPAVEASGVELPKPAFESDAPEQMKSQEELFLAGLHLFQYRHATRSPEAYWNEALRRDPGDSRVNTALAKLCLSRGQLDEALNYANAAVARVTWRNPNPYDSEPYYVLGRVLQAKGDDAAAYDAFAKATWSEAWKVPSWEQMSRIDLRHGRPRVALTHLESALPLAGEGLETRNLLAAAKERLGDSSGAHELRVQNLKLDPLDPWTRFSLDGVLTGDAQVGIDVALELASIGETEQALTALRLADRLLGDLPNGQSNPAPLIGYHRWDILTQAGRMEEAEEALREVQRRERVRAFPGRLQDALVLMRAAEQEGNDSVAAGLLGHWLYANKRQADALEQWRHAPQDDPVILRNLGVAAVNHLNDLTLATEYYEKAFQFAPDDERLLYERDQLAMRLGESVDDRISRLEAHPALVSRRSDLSATLAMLLVLTGRLDDASEVLSARRFQPWEGGEGVVLSVWEALKKAQAELALEQGNPEVSLDFLSAALDPPEYLGEDRHPLANCADLLLLRGDALKALGRNEEAINAWRSAASAHGDFVSMAPTGYSVKTVFSAQALDRLGDQSGSKRLLEALLAEGERLRETPAKVDYFATSLPSMLLFNEDLENTKNLRADTMRAQAFAGLGRPESARDLALEVLAHDPSQVWAVELLRSLGD